MSLEAFLKSSKDTIQDNAPSILAALAVGGVATTGLVAFGAGRKYQAELDMYDEELPAKKRFEIGWRPVLPAIILGTVTVVCVISGTAINNRRNALLGGALTLTETAYREYKDKAEKVMTKQKREQVDQELAQEKLDKAPSNEVVVIGDGDVLMFDTLTSRTFKSTKLAIEKAEVEIGRRLLSEMYVSQNEWYDEIGLPRTSMGDDVGWNHDNPLEVKFVALMRDEKPVIGIDYRFRPSVSFNRFG